MPDKKLTDNEIIKALECCKSDTSVCGECPYDKIGECIEKMCADSIDLINRLQAENSNLTSDLTSLKTYLTSLRAENERLQNRVDEYNIQVVNQREQIEKYEPIKETLCVIWENMLSISVARGKEKPTLEELAGAVDYIKAKAYKEFAERFENRILSILTTATLDEKDFVCTCIGIKNNLLKELVGEGDTSLNNKNKI